MCFLINHKVQDLVVILFNIYQTDNKINYIQYIYEYYIDDKIIHV